MTLFAERRRRPRIPATVNIAAALFFLYGIAAVINAAGAQTDAGWVGGRVLPRMIVRLIASCVIAWGLTRGARWAWWLGVVAGTIWFGMSVSTVLVMESGDIRWLEPSPAQLLLAASLVSLGTALGLLLTREARAAFREPRA